jgi:hypothetical protein
VSTAAILQRRDGRYEIRNKFKSNFKYARLKAAATKSKAVCRVRHDMGVLGGFQ